MTEILLLALALLGIAGGLYLAIAFQLRPWSAPVAALFALAGVRDRVRALDRPRPMEAFLATALFDITVGAAVAAWFAHQQVGAGVLLWVWIAAILAASLEYAGAIVSPLRRFAPPAALISVLVALFQGTALPASIVHQAWAAPRLTPWFVALIALLIGAAYALLWMGRPWAQRFLFARGGQLVLLVMVIAALALITGGASNSFTLAGVFGDFLPAGANDLAGKLISVGAFLALSGAGGLRSADWNRRIRAEHPGGGALAFALRPILAAVVFSLVLCRLSSEQPIDAGALAWFGLGALLAGMVHWTASAETAAHFLRETLGDGAARLMLWLSAPAFVLIWIWAYMSAESDGIILHAALFSGAFAALFAWGAAFFDAEQGAEADQRFQKREAELDAPDFSGSALILFLHAFPSALLSRLFGLFARLPIPRTLRAGIYGIYIRMFKVDMGEAERPVEDYRNFVDFFTRALKPGLRPLDRRREAAISPVDGVLARSGNISRDQLIQAKGLNYSCLDLVQSNELAERFEGGWFATLYLSPRDYHRIHTPVAGAILGYDYTPGLLLPVNPPAVQSIQDLFPKNERLTTLLQVGRHLCAVVKVGATNVGSMRVSYAPVSTNRWLRSPARFRFPIPPPIDRGAELGRFEMGSTVVLLFSKGAVRPLAGIEGPIRLGQAIALLQK